MAFTFYCQECGKRVSPSSPIREMNGKAVGPCCYKFTSIETQTSTDKTEIISSVTNFGEAGEFLSTKGFACKLNPDSLSPETFEFLAKSRDLSRTRMMLVGNKTITDIAHKIIYRFPDRNVHVEFILWASPQTGYDWELFLSDHSHLEWSEFTGGKWDDFISDYNKYLED